MSSNKSKSVSKSLIIKNPKKVKFYANKKDFIKKLTSTFEKRLSNVDDNSKILFGGIYCITISK